jgi:6-phosphogluconolactonase (cycloisomerase 2 family)
VLRIPRRPGRWIAVLAAALAALAWTASAMASQPHGSVYTQTNDPAGNRVQILAASRDGAPAPYRSVPTGGLGTGAGLGSQGAVVVTGRWLLAVNAGSDELSLFRVHRRGLSLADVVPSGGDMPVSVTSDGRRAYAVNAGGEGGVAGFEITHEGRLVPIAGSRRPLSAPGAGPAQIERSPDGSTLVVTEKATSRIGTYPVAADGSVGPPTFTAAAGETPFGFAFDRRGRAFVSEAFGGRPGESAVSSYAIAASGGVVPISAAVPTRQTAACWVVVTASGRIAYTANTGSDSITGYAIARDGGIARLDEDGVTARTGDGPADLALDRSGRVLYVLNGAEGSIGAFRVRHDGALHPIGSVGGLPANAAAGLATR